MSGLVFEPIEAEPADDHGPAGVTLGRPERPGRWRPALVAAVAVALVASVAFLGRNGGGASAPPTTIPTTTVAPTTTTRPSRRTGPAYSEDRAFMNFLGAQSGVRLYAVSTEGAIVGLDLDGGVVTQRRLRRSDRGEMPATIFARTASAVVVSQDQTVAVGDGPDGVVIYLAPKDTSVFPATATGDVWLVHTAGTTGRIAERRAVQTGAVNGTIPDLLAGDVLGDDGTGAVLVQTGSGVYRVDGAGDRPQRVSADPVVAWSAVTLVVQHCDDRFQCEWDQVDRATGERRAIGAAPWGGSVLAPGLSPDGTRLAYVGGVGGPTSPVLEVMDVTNGAHAAIDHQVALATGSSGPTGLVWSADGQWLFWLTPPGALRAWHVGAAEPITVTGAGHIPRLASIGLAA